MDALMVCDIFHTFDKRQLYWRYINVLSLWIKPCQKYRNCCHYFLSNPCICIHSCLLFHIYPIYYFFLYLYLNLFFPSILCSIPQSTGAQEWHIVSLLADVTFPTTVTHYVSMTSDLRVLSTEKHWQPGRQHTVYTDKRIECKDEVHSSPLNK